MSRGPSGAAALPPADLAQRPLPLETLAAGTRLARIHGRSRDPVHFSPGPGKPPAGRFDSASGRFGVLYAALSFDGAFVEAVLRNPARRVVGEGEIAARAFTILAPRETLPIVDLTGPGLQALGLDAAIFAGPYAPCGAWADALRDHPARPGGLLYPSRHDPAEHCLALFGPRPMQVLAPSEPLDDLPAQVAAALRRYGKALDPG